MKKRAGISFAWLRWCLPVVLLVALLIMGWRGMLVVHETLQLQAALDATLGREAALTMLSPLYVHLQEEAAELAADDQLVLPPLSPLGLEEVPALSDLFQGMVRKHGFKAQEIGFQVQTQNGHRHLQVSLPLQGRYQRLGPLLAELIALPALVSVDRLSAVWNENGDVIAITCKLALE